MLPSVVYIIVNAAKAAVNSCAGRVGIHTWRFGVNESAEEVKSLGLAGRTVTGELGRGNHALGVNLAVVCAIS